MRLIPTNCLFYYLEDTIIIKNLVGAPSVRTPSGFITEPFTCNIQQVIGYRHIQSRAPPHINRHPLASKKINYSNELFSF